MICCYSVFLCSSLLVSVECSVSDFSTKVDNSEKSAPQFTHTKRESSC